MAKRDRGQGGLFKTERSQFYYAQYYSPSGRQIRVSTGTAIKEKAEKILRKLLEGRDNGAAPINEVRRLKYADLRKILVAHYEAKGRKSLRLKADGSEGIPGLTALDQFCEYKTELVDGNLTVTHAGVPVTSLTSDFARRFVAERKKKD